ncbi:hypothetical protein GQ53DRAFT_855905 [Thozetella sp. PMI_491]|nr:hypothetical protein GQ53DRAFT_855905 [Thozetella sp. PMI_491]
MLTFKAIYVIALAVGVPASAGPVILKRQGSAGCGNTHNIGYNTNHGAGFSLGSRTYTVLVPTGYDPSKAYPLIVDFHGHNGTSDGQHNTSQYDLFDTTGQFLVVYPQGVKYPNAKGELEPAWEGPSYADPTVDDKAFTVDLVQHMEASYCIDSTRIYASGKSNGGGFVGTLACSPQGSIFAAFAMNSAALYTDNLGAGAGGRTCTPSRASIPIIEVHGSADSKISYDGGKGSGGTTPPIPSWLAAWSSRDQTGPATPHNPSPTYGSRVNLTTWHVTGTTEIVVEGIWIQEMDHCWASVDRNHDWDAFGTKKCKAPLNASELFMSFFNNWDLNGFRG